MKLATYYARNEPPSLARLGALISFKEPRDVRILDLAAIERAMHSVSTGAMENMQAWLESGPAKYDRALHLIERASEFPEMLVPLDQVHLLAPLPRPQSLRDCLVFEGHWIQSARQIASSYVPLLGKFDALVERITGRGLLKPPRVWYERPLYYKGNPASVVGHDADVEWPAFSQQLDFELEFGVFIGRTCRDVSEKEAEQCIAGYAIFNDFSARDVQRGEMAGRLGPAKCKDFDTGNAIGPWLTTADEVPNGAALRMEARVNGEPWCRATTADMHFSFAEIVAYISQSETLHPGDFIASGTPRNGCGWEQGRSLKPNDIIELEVERLGTLRNRVVRQIGAT